jgi:hypothetical protein
MKKENVKFTTPTQQSHNNHSHDSGPYTLGLLCDCCDSVVYESNPKMLDSLS